MDREQPILSADSEEVAREAERTDEQQEVITTTRSQLDQVRQRLSITDQIKTFFGEITAKIRTVLVSMGFKFFESDSTSQPAVDAGAEQQPSDSEIKTLTFNREGTRENRNKVYNKCERQGNLFTGGMIGRLWGDERIHESGDANFDINSQFALGQIEDLKQSGITAVITLSGGGSHEAIQSKFAQLGLGHIKLLKLSIPRADTVEEAHQKWRSDSFVSKIKQAFTLYKNEKSFCHCHNGMHRSVSCALILHMLDKPDLSYQQALQQNVSSREQRDPNFLAYAPLAQALENNPTLRARILNASA